MNVETKIWNFSGSGTKIHAYINGRTAACRSNINRPAGSDMDYCEAKQAFKFSICITCEAKFDAAIERAEDAMRPSTGEGDHLPTSKDETMNTAHPAAGTYYPATANGWDLMLQGRQISARVQTDGSYTVYAGSMVIDSDVLDGTEGNLMGWFAGVAWSWSAGIDADRKANAEEEQAAFERHLAELTPVKQTTDEIIDMVATLGGEYRAENDGLPSQIVSHLHVTGALRTADKHGINVDVVDVPGKSDWYIELNDAAGSHYGRYHFLGR